VGSSSLSAFSPSPWAVMPEQTIFDHQVVLAADAVVNRVHRDRPAFDDQPILAGDAVVVGALHGQRAGAGDGQVGFAEEGGVGFVLGRVGEDVGRGVGDRVLRAVRQHDHDLLGVAHKESAR
jgi:hypothetical protein